LAPDVALLGNTLPDLTGFEILAITKAENRPTRLVFFAESEGNDDLTAAIAAGACSAISRYANPDTMLRSLRLMTERISASPDGSQDLSPNGKEVDGAKIERMLAMLTHRERQIMRLVSEGLSNKEIARELNVSQGTVKVHLYNMFQKLEISNRTVLATIALLQRSAGFGTLSLAALAFAILSDAKASNTNDTFLDDDSTAHKDLEPSGFELWKKAILRHILVVDPGETVVLTQRDSSIKPSQVTHPAARMEELRAAEQAVLSSLGRGYGPIGSSTPYLSISPLLQAINDSQIGSPTAQQQFPPLEFTSNPIKSHGGYGTFAMTAAGVWIYALDNSHAAVQALDPGETLIDASTVATMDGTAQVATITIHGASNVDRNDVDNLAPGPVVHDSHPPLAFATLGHDSVTGEGNTGQIIHGGAGDDAVNGTALVDVICGGSGNDTIEGNGGDDTIYGGSGGDTINGHNGNDTIIGGYGGDQLTGSNGDDIFVYLSATDSNSIHFDTIIDFTSGEDKINLAAFGALAFLHMTSTSTSVPPHTLAWIYSPVSNETIIYVNPTDRSLDIGDPGLLEIHLQGVVSVADSDFVYEPDAAAVAAALEGIDPALMVATASDGTVLMTGSAEAGASESTSVTAGIWTMPADDGLKFNFGRDRIGSIASSRLTSSGDDSAYATEESDDGSVSVPAHVSSIELAHSHASVMIEENLTFKKEPAQANTGAVTTGHGKAHATTGLELFEFGMQSAAIVAPVAVAEPVGPSVITGNSGGHGNSQHGSQSAPAKWSAAAEPAEPGIKPGNGIGHGNEQHASNSAAAKASAAAELTAPGVAAVHSNSEHPSHSASPSAMGAAEPIEPSVAPGNSASHGNSQHGSQSASAKSSAAAEPAEPDIKPGNGVGHGNEQHASNSAAAKVSAAGELTELGVTPGHNNLQHHAATANVLGASELTDPGVISGNGVVHGNSHSSHLVSASAKGPAEPVDTGVAPGSGGSQGNSPQTSQAAAEQAAAEPAGPDLTPSKGGSNGNWHHASHSVAANASAAAQPAEPASATGDEGSALAFHFKNQGAPSTTAVELEELTSSPLLLGHGAELAAILEVDPAAMHEHAASHVDNGQHHAIGHLPPELLT
jgi:VCBS repeat-containing protein